MQFKVPQDVQQADRIVAFLTLPQLIICVIGFAVSYGVYAALNNQGLPMIIWLPPIMVIGGLTLAFAFLKIANLPFHQYLALLIERFITPSKRVWVKGGDRVINDEVYVSAEDKKTGEKTKKMNELQQQKEEKMQNISEITDILDTLKKEPVKKEAALEKIDQADDKELLKTAFLDEKKQPVKTPETVEDKIVSLSQLPKVEAPAQIVTAPKNGSEIPADPEKKKRRRKRRRKKKPAEQNQNLAPVQSVPTPAPAAKIEPTTPKKEVPTTTERTQKTEPALPSWLKEEASKASAPKEPEKKPLAEPQLNNSQPVLKSSFEGGRGAIATEEVNSSEGRRGATATKEPNPPTPEVKTPPSIAPTEKPKEPSIPSWLKEEAPKAPSPKEPEKKPSAEPQLKNSQPVLKSSFDESSKAGEASPDKGSGVGKGAEEVNPPQTELELEAPEKELELEAPEVELELEAPEVELELEAPEVELELKAPAQTKTTPTSQPSTLNSQPSTPPPEKTIKSEEIFTADQLKQGQTIKIPKS
jgi:hypothetical protein